MTDDMENEDMEMSAEEQAEQRLMAEKIKHLRESRGLTRVELAAALGTPFTEEMVAEYETGDVSMEATRVLSMMKALDASGESVNPKRLMADRLIRNGYGKLSEERRRVVDLLASALMEDQEREFSSENSES